ncbi:hypothetical protein P5V15_007901 [Pogonomyrmex californicus]
MRVQGQPVVLLDSEHVRAWPKKLIRIRRWTVCSSPSPHVGSPKYRRENNAHAAAPPVVDRRNEETKKRDSVGKARGERKRRISREAAPAASCHTLDCHTISGP